MMSSKVILLCFFSVLEGFLLAMEEPPSPSSHNQRLNPVMSSLNFDEPSEKRAYTYVSEYKRLPVYNFGLGKRWVDTGDDKRARPFSFGLGKRTRPYSFGLGKRNDNQDYHTARLSLDYFPLDNVYENYQSHEEDPIDYVQDKRGSNRLYSFGLGKRAWNLAADESMPTGKRPNDVPSQRYMFGLGKRTAEEDQDSIQ